MALNPMTPPSSQVTYPWQIKEMSAGLRFLVLLGIMVLVLIAIGTAFGVLIGLGVLFSSTTDTFISNLLIVVGNLVLAGGSITALIFLFPQARKPPRFAPKTGIIDPTRTAAPFGVKFEPRAFSTSLRGDGSVTFTDNDVTVSGTVPPNGLVQLGVILVVTVLPLAIFGCGLGILPAIIIANYIGRKQVTVPVAYSQMMVKGVKGTTVEMSAPAASPNNFRFRVSSTDGERLYRELYKRFPQAVSQWEPQLSMLTKGAPSSV